MIKYTHEENRQMVNIMTLQAHELGLLDGDAKLVYGKGNTSYGHATEIYVEKTIEGQRLRQMRPQWVPEFGYKDGPSVVGSVLVATQNVLYTFLTRKHEA